MRVNNDELFYVRAVEILLRDKGEQDLQRFFIIIQKLFFLGPRKKQNSLRIQSQRSDHGGNSVIVSVDMARDDGFDIHSTTSFPHEQAEPPLMASGAFRG